MGACPQARCCPTSLFLAWSSFWSAVLEFLEGRAYGWAISEIPSLEGKVMPPVGHSPGVGPGQRWRQGLPWGFSH